MTGSPFYEPPKDYDAWLKTKAIESQKLLAAERKAHPMQTLQSGPTKQELEDWYRILNDSVEVFDGTPHGDILTDLRDEIYKHLY